MLIKMINDTRLHRSTAWPAVPSLTVPSLTVPSPAKSRIVGSLTTLPNRYEKLYHTLLSLHEQETKLDAIYLCIANVASRLNEKYPVIPDKISKLCTVVNIDRDYGPCTKLLGGLIKESDPEAIIITFDDDVIYHPELVSTLMQHNKNYPNIAIGSIGMTINNDFPFYGIYDPEHKTLNNTFCCNIPETGRNVDILFGVGSVLYYRKFFPESFQEIKMDMLTYPIENFDVFINDDVMISGYLSTRDIERKIFKDTPVFVEKLFHDDNNEISNDKIQFVSRLCKAVKFLKGKGYYHHTYSIDVSETIGGRVILLLAVIFLIILIIVVACNCFSYHTRR